MSVRGRSPSPRAVDQDADMEPAGNPSARVVIITNLSRNVVETHLKTIFGFYGEIIQIDLPLYGKSGQNRGKAALEYSDSPAAQKAASHMNGGQIDGAVVKDPVCPEMVLDPALSLALVPGLARPHSAVEAQMVLAYAIPTVVAPSVEVPHLLDVTFTADALARVLHLVVGPPKIVADAHQATNAPFSLQVHVALSLPFLFIVAL
ncbi:hypothetical protein FB45DRAFT_1054862 [Roridomyces roridus]|uniref:RRM domain-containing protein n=1 Tax=Roridomyces roridus TaxID=1738132 RepID=A0AAD7FTN3_9AGAR|nr:hypothetical protein FB45DRAFT_1054862 [Roridomyces roridus]